MARLNDADIARLLTGLGEPPGHAAALPVEEREAPQPSPAPEVMLIEIAQLQTRLEDAARGPTLRGALETMLRDYLRHDVACSVGDDALMPAETLRFEGGEPLEWHLDVAVPLAAMLGDLTIGGDGTGIRHTNRRRLGRLIEPLATRIAALIAEAAGAEPVPLRFIEVARRAATPLLSGSIEIGTAKGDWVVGAALRASRAIPSTAAPGAARAVTAPSAQERLLFRPEPAGEPSPSKPSREVVHPVMEPPGGVDARQPGVGSSHERVIAPKPVGSNGAFAGAVAAACSRLGEITRCVIAADAIDVKRVETPSLSRDALKLALIAGGPGSLVLSADEEAVTTVAAATIGALKPADGKPGAVVIDAVEAVLRAALRGFADSLPGIAGGPQRFVRLAEGALPARSPHYAIEAPLHIGEHAATLRWLVPTWMATAKGEERAPNDGR
jgi:hypothetical protein